MPDLTFPVVALTNGTLIPELRHRSPLEHPVVRALAVLALLFVFLVGVNGLGDGFKSLGQNLLDSFFRATENPFMGLMVGVLATTLVQSSSVSTSLIVGLVAAPANPLPLANAIPMIMGANIGTTVTNTLVSLAHMGRRQEFERAFAVATCHDFFNFLAVAVFLPLEMATGFLQKTATALSGLLTGVGGVDYDSPLKGALKAVVAPIKELLHALIPSDHAAAIALILFSGVLIYVALMLLVKTMRGFMQSRVETIVGRGLHKAPVFAILVGILVTVMVQSSSITTLSSGSPGRRRPDHARAGIPDHHRREYRNDRHGRSCRSRGYRPERALGNHRRDRSLSVQSLCDATDLPVPEDPGDPFERCSPAGRDRSRVEEVGVHLRARPVLRDSTAVRRDQPFPRLILGAGC